MCPNSAFHFLELSKAAQRGWAFFAYPIGTSSHLRGPGTGAAGWLEFLYFSNVTPSQQSQIAHHLV